MYVTCILTIFFFIEFCAAILLFSKKKHATHARTHATTRIYTHALFCIVI